MVRTRLLAARFFEEAMCAAERPECAICAPAGGARPALNTLVQPWRRSTTRLTHSSVSATFKDGRSIQGTIDVRRSGALSPSALPPIRVFEKDGVIYTVDKRRPIRHKPGWCAGRYARRYRPRDRVPASNGWTVAFWFRAAQPPLRECVYQCSRCFSCVSRWRWSSDECK
jgi:hypothetical protein